MTLGAFLLEKAWFRVVGATLASVGLSLISVVVLVAVVYSFFPCSSIAKSPLLLLGIPLGMFTFALWVLLRSARASIQVSTMCAAAGLAGLYWLGGFVLRQSVCSFRWGECLYSKA